MGRERTEGVEGQRRKGRPKTIHRPLVGCREGNGAYAPRRACAPRAAAEEIAWRHRPLGGAERNEHVE